MHITHTKKWEKVWWAPLYSTQVSFQVQVQKRVFWGSKNSQNDRMVLFTYYAWHSVISARARFWTHLDLEWPKNHPFCTHPAPEMTLQGGLKGPKSCFPKFIQIIASQVSGMGSFSGCPYLSGSVGFNVRGHCMSVKQLFITVEWDCHRDKRTFKPWSNRLSW